MYYVYILKSQKDNKFYVGTTSNIKRRLNEHKNGKVWSTSRRLPVKLIYCEYYLQKTDAERNEKYYKTTKGREDLRKKLLDFLGL